MGIPEPGPRIMPYGSAAGCIVERRRKSAMIWAVSRNVSSYSMCKTKSAYGWVGGETEEEEVVFTRQQTRDRVF